MADPILTKYIQENLARKVPLGQIEQTLLSAGWNPSLVREAASSFRQQTPLQQPAPHQPNQQQPLLGQPARQQFPSGQPPKQFPRQPQQNQLNPGQALPRRTTQQTNTLTRQAAPPANPPGRKKTSILIILLMVLAALLGAAALLYFFTPLKASLDGLLGIGVGGSGQTGTAETGTGGTGGAMNQSAQQGTMGAGLGGQESPGQNYTNPSPQAMKECGTDMGCFAGAAAACTPSSAAGESERDFLGISITTKYYYELRGLNRDRCVFFILVENVTLDYGSSADFIAVAQEEANARVLKGEYGTCSYTLPSLTAMLNRWSAGNYDTEKVICTPTSSGNKCTRTGGDFAGADCQGPYFDNVTS